MSQEPVADAGGRSLSIDELADLREKTEIVSQFFRARLEGHLETVRLAFAPRRVLGKHERNGARDDIVGSDRAFEQLKATYAGYNGRPFLLPRELDDDPVSIEGVLDLYPWEYTHLLDDKAIKMTSPIRWVVNYRSGYSLEQLREAIEAKQTPRQDDAERYVVGALTLEMLLEKFPGVSKLLTDLRYQVEVAPHPELGNLPTVTIAASLPSFRPADDLIQSATRFSGVAEFIELIDVEALGGLEDPLKAELGAALEPSAPAEGG